MEQKRNRWSEQPFPHDPYDIGHWVFRDGCDRSPGSEPERTREALVLDAPDDSLSLDRKPDLFLRAGIARVDNIFQKNRHLINAFERPIGTSSGYNKVWYSYAPYNPEIVQKYLGIFRTVNNSVWVSEEDGKTLAMRLGLVKRPLQLEGIP